jgi:hypothetical protein
MEAFSAVMAFPLAAIPFATSIVLVLGSPGAAAADRQPLVSTRVGPIVVKLCGPAMAAAVGLAMIAMHLTSTSRPRAGVDPLVVAKNIVVGLSRRTGRQRRTPVGRTPVG